MSNESSSQPNCWKYGNTKKFQSVWDTAPAQSSTTTFGHQPPQKTSINHHSSDPVGFCTSILCVLQLTPEDVLWSCPMTLCHVYPKVAPQDTGFGNEVDVNISYWGSPVGLCIQTAMSLLVSLTDTPRETAPSARSL